MKLETIYEYEVAEVINREVISLAYFETLSEAKNFISDEPNFRLYSLCRKVGNDIRGEISRANAYYNERGILGIVFNDGTRVPEKFLREKI